MRAITDLVSKTKVRFKMPVEQAGRILLAMAVGYVMVCFTTMTLHTAPLPEHAFGGAFHQAQGGGDQVKFGGHFFGFSPDRQWLAFVHNRSAEGGALARFFGPRQFDPHGRFLFKYGARRRRLEEHNKVTGTVRVR